MIKAIITDFDGTLVDTFEANLCAYQKAFMRVGKNLDAEKYKECFGYRFDQFMEVMKIEDDSVANVIKEYKKDVYPSFFNLFVKNNRLIELIATFHCLGGKTAIASTARKENLLNAVEYLGVSQYFDLIYAGADVKKGKPSPEIYLKVIQELGVLPAEVMIFEDSAVGIEAARASGANYIPVSSKWFE